MVFVGHSVSAMIGVLASATRGHSGSPSWCSDPAPRYIDDGDYRGGFSRADIEELLGR